MSSKPPLIIIAGPTACGKTALSVSLAKAISGSVVSADSMQVYRRMDIGSAKVTPEERSGIPHYLIDCLEPTEDFNVYRFTTMAKEAFADIYRQGRIPILAGGTGFYVHALLYDAEFEEEAGDCELRKKLENEAEAIGALAMHEKLRAVDAAAADAIHPNNRKRVIRAIEYFLTTGQKISEHNDEQHAKESPYDFLYVVLTRDRADLYDRIDRRVDKMMEDGLLQEVKKLRAEGCARGLSSMQGLGYKEILDYLEGEMTLDEAVFTIKRDTRHFAKRQLTWFRREPDAVWVNTDHKNTEELTEEVLRLWEERTSGKETV